MFKKLLKYDLKALYKPLLIYAIGITTCAIITRLTTIQYSDLPPYETTTPVFITIINTICYNAFYALSVALIVTIFIRIWRHYAINFYGDESYLTHTLPIPRHTLWNSKFLSSIIAILFGLVIIAIGIFIIYYSPEQLETFKFSISPSGYHGSIVLFVLLLSIATFAQFTFITQVGLLGITIGNQANNNRTARAVAIGLISYLLSGLLTVIIVSLWTTIDQTIANSLFGNSIDSDIIPKILLGIIIIYTLFISTTYIVINHSLRKGIDIE